MAARRFSVLSLATHLMSAYSLRAVARLRGGDAFRAHGARMLSSMTVAAPTTIPTVTSAALAAFEVIRTEDVAEYNVSAVLYRHRRTGAEVLSIEAPHEDNKVFGINLKTLPKDDTGVPHILEHSVLCGSRKYPSKEPFVELLKGSLKTFLNAFTMADRTCYPVASQNTQDFYNLVDVYLDSVLHPRLGPNVLKQEGWSYQAEEGSNELKYKGVVFNEMKGVYSSADSRNFRLCQRAVFQGHPIYAVDSGGDPEAIPNLSYEQFEAFHRRYYHPSNARFFFYGDDEPAARLAKLEEFLADFGESEAAPELIPIQPKAKAPYEVLEAYPADEKAPDGPKQFVTLSWLLNEEPMDPVTKLAWTICNTMLLGSASAELRKPLIESKLGAALTGGGYSSYLQQATFSVGLKGVAVGEEPKAQVRELVLETLERLASDGFPQESVEAAMNTVEFRMREFNTGGMPKGLSLMLATLNEWNYARDPLAPLKFEAPLAELKAKLAAGEPVFQQLIRAFLLDNPSRVTVQLVPEAGLEKVLEAREAEELRLVREQLSASELSALEVETVELKARQAAEDSAEDLAKIPVLSVGDLEEKSTAIPIEVREAGAGATELRHELPTAGVLYVDVALPLQRLKLEELPLLPLLTRMLSELGTSALDETGFSNRKGTHTGGVRISTYTSALPAQPEQVAAYLLVRGKAMAPKASTLFDIMGEVLHDVGLDQQSRVLEMLKEGISRTEASVVSSGNAYAASSLGSRYSLAGYLGELQGGVKQLEAMRAALKQAESDWPSLRERLEAMRAALLCRDGAIINLSANQGEMEGAQPAVDSFLSRLPEHSAPLNSWERPRLITPSYEGLQVGTQVNYVAKAAQIYPPGELAPGSSSVVTRFLRTSYLWDKVRVQGGAYGCSLSFNRYSGLACFSSYRDPNLERTLAAYDGVPAFLREQSSLARSELDKAIIGAVGEMDSPMSADAKGFTSMIRYLLGVSEEERQRFRSEVLATSHDDFVGFAERLETVAAEGSVAVVGSEKAFKEASSLGLQVRQLP